MSDTKARPKMTVDDYLDLAMLCEFKPLSQTVDDYLHLFDDVPDETGGKCTHLLIEARLYTDDSIRDENDRHSGYMSRLAASLDADLWDETDRHLGLLVRIGEPCDEASLRELSEENDRDAARMKELANARAAYTRCEDARHSDCLRRLADIRSDIGRRLEAEGAEPKAAPRPDAPVVRVHRFVPGRPQTAGEMGPCGGEFDGELDE